MATSTQFIAIAMGSGIGVYFVWKLYAMGREDWISKFGSPEEREQLRLAQIEQAKQRVELAKHKPKKTDKDDESLCG